MDESALAAEYQLLEELGSGSFGVVYKAVERETGEVVAVKLIDLESTDDDIQEIQQEINVLSTCASSFVTQYRRSFLRGSKLWIVMEYLGGGSCSDLLKPGPFNESHVAIVCRELLLGLDYLHREGKIHRDIKAANVLLAQSGKVKLADFGVAAQMSNLKSIRNTFVGTPYWMAPEVIQEAGYDARADIWSLGITAMELINGEPPHAQIHPMKVLFQIPKVPAPRLEGSRYSKDLREFVAACLVKDPDRRPGAKELLQHRFIRHAGKVEGLQELVIRRQMWDSQQGRVAHPKLYAETMTSMSVVDEDEDDWVFDTVKAPTMAPPPRLMTAKRRKTPTVDPMPILEDGCVSTEQMLSQLSLDEQSAPATQRRMPETMRRVSAKRRASPTEQLASPAKRTASASRPNGNAPAVRQPLAPDLSFGNTASTTRLFRRLSDATSPNGTWSSSSTVNDENRPPSAGTDVSLLDAVTKESVVARRAYARAVDTAFQEVHAQTGNHSRREAIARAAQAWNALDMHDPEGEFQLLKTILEKVHNDPQLSSLLPSAASPQNASSLNSMHKPKLVLSSSNPHLRSHRRRQSSWMSQAASPDPLEDKLQHLPGTAVPGLEHTKQLADVLYGKWAEGLQNRWPAMAA